MKTLRPEIAFLILGLLFGIGFLVLNPPFQAPDEAFHMFRSWEISQGKLEDNTQNGLTHMQVPKSFIEFLKPSLAVLSHPRVKTSTQEILQFRNKALEAQSTQDSTFVSTVPHPFLPYLPQTAAMILGRWANLSPFYLLYLGRFVNFMVWLALIYLALRSSPIFQWTFTLLALSPMSVYQGASLSPDATTNGLAFLLIAQALRLMLSPEGTARLQSLGKMMVSSASLTLSKLVYLGHAGLFFLIPREKFGNRTRYWLGLSIFVALHAAILAWFFHGPALVSRAETKSQLQWLLEHPLGYCGILAKTLLKLGWPLAKQFVGTFGQLDTPLPEVLVLTYLAILFLVVCLDRGVVRSLYWSEKVALAGIATAEIFVIFTSVFVTWSHFGNSVIAGVQGRYFIPVAPLVALTAYRRAPAETAPRKFLGPLCVYFSGMALTVSLFILKDRFY